MTWIKIVPDNNPNADGKWIEVETKIEPNPTRGWFQKMLDLHAVDIPPGFHAVQFETIGGTFLSKPETSGDSVRNSRVLSDSS